MNKLREGLQALGVLSATALLLGFVIFVTLSAPI